MFLKQGDCVSPRPRRNPTRGPSCDFDISFVFRISNLKEKRQEKGRKGDNARFLHTFPRHSTADACLYSGMAADANPLVMPAR